MEEKLNEEVETYLDIIAPLTKNSLGLIESEDWVYSEDRAEVFNLQYMLTERNLKYALELQTKAFFFKEHERPEVIRAVKELMYFYDIFVQRFNAYNENSSSVMQNLSEKKSKRYGKAKLTAMEYEIKFQSDLTNAYTKLTLLYKKIINATSEDRVVIPTFNDEPLPLLMREQLEETFPQLKKFLEKQDGVKELSKGSSTESIGVPE